MSGQRCWFTSQAVGTDMVSPGLVGETVSLGWVVFAVS